MPSDTPIEPDREDEFRLPPPLELEVMRRESRHRNQVQRFYSDQIITPGPLRTVGDSNWGTHTYSYGSGMGDIELIDNRPPDMAPVSAPPQPEPELRQIENATHHTRLEIAARHIEVFQRRNIPYGGSLGRRESEYIDMLRNQKRNSMRAHEFIFSEVPQLVARVPNGILKDIVTSNLCSDLLSIRSGYHFVCHSCKLDTPAEYAFFCNGKIWCAEHIPNLDSCAVCHELQPNCTLVSNRYHDEVHACETCLRQLSIGGISCRHCSYTLPINGIEWVGTGRCPHCINSRERHGDYRNFSRELKWVGKDKGAIVRSTRIFSCEIEALTANDHGVERLSEAIPEECGITTDGSVQPDKDEIQSGLEIQTPKLAGKKGEECIRRTISCLHSVEAVVNDTCGLHIHLDGKGILLPTRREYPLALLQLWKTHLIFEDVMLSFLPFQRRSNDFCRLMAASFKISEVDMCETIFDVEKLWYKVTTHRDIRANKTHHYHSSRYFGVNLHSLLGQGHLEIRYHSGTTNGRKILEWANLHCILMDACATKKMTFDFFKEAQTTTNLRQKTDLLFDKIGMSESSKQYFYRRQKKFSDKKNDESVLA